MSKKRWFLFIIFGIIFFLVAANCTLARIVLDEVNRDQTNTVAARYTIHSSTYTHQAETNDSRDATNWHASEIAQTATQQVFIATDNALGTSQAQTQAAPKPPIITGINFPSEIPGNKSTIIGLLHFTDPDGDISHVTYEVVSATDFGGGTDDAPRLDSGSWKDGALKIYLWCEGQQTVTLLATLHDNAGNESNSMSFTFTCK